MFKQVFVLFIITYVFNSVYAGEICSAVNSGNKIEVTIDSQNIAFIGWTHLSAEASLSFQNTIGKSAVAAKSLDCSSAKTLLQDMLITNPEREKNAIAAYDLIKKAIEEYKRTYLGLEFADSEIDLQYANLAITAKQLKSISQQCGNTVPLELIERVEKVFPGPAFAILNQYKSLIKLPLESAELKSKAYNFLATLSDAPDVEASEVKPEAILKIQEVIESGALITDEIISNILKGALTENAKLVIESQLKAMQGIQQNAIDRNSFIVNRILQTKQNMVILIGEAHLSDLYQTLLATCQ